MRAGKDYVENRPSPQGRLWIATKQFTIALKGTLPGYILSDGRWMGAGRVVVPGEEPEPGNQDSFNRWVSRTWYDVVGSGDLRHYRAGTRVERIANFQQLCGYAAKRYIWNVRLAALLGIPKSAMTVDTLFTDRIRWGEQELQRRALKTAHLKAAKPICHPALCKAEKLIHIVGSL